MNILEHPDKQKLINYIFGGYDVAEHHKDLEYISFVVKDHFGINISIYEAEIFWSWRSIEWDASFLTVSKDNSGRYEIIEWFEEYVNNFYEDFDDDEIIEILEKMEKQ